jgi:hypothetical protein
MVILPIIRLTTQYDGGLTRVQAEDLAAKGKALRMRVLTGLVGGVCVGEEDARVTIAEGLL